MRQDRHLALVIDRVNRGKYTPEEVQMQLCGRGYDPMVIEYLCKCSETIRSEKPQPIPKSIFSPPPPRPKKRNYAKIVIAKDPEYHTDGTAWHSYWGGWFGNRFFVKSFKDGKVELSKEEKDACKFYDDRECDECMARLIIDHHVWTISIWEDGFQGVHYPNNHWCDNGFLQPSFINREDVGAFHREGIVFNQRQGWHKKE